MCSWPLRVTHYCRMSVTWCHSKTMHNPASWPHEQKRGSIKSVSKICPPSFLHVLLTIHTTRQATYFYAHTQMVVRCWVGKTFICSDTIAYAAYTCPAMARIQCAAELCFLLCRRKHPQQNKKRSCSPPKTTVGSKDTTQPEKGHTQNEQLQCGFL